MKSNVFVDGGLPTVLMSVKCIFTIVLPSVKKQKSKGYFHYNYVKQQYLFCWVDNAILAIKTLKNYIKMVYGDVWSM